MDEKEFLKQLDKRLQNVATREDLQKVKDELSIVKVDVGVMKEEWGEKIDKIDRRVNDVYNLADKIAKGIEKREQEFYSREAQVIRKLKTVGEKVGIDISKIE
jgi:hypothetical protein